MTGTWPALSYEPWRETCAALHLFTQIVGKYRMAHTPWINHAWHATLYVNARGFTTSLVPDGVLGAEISIDLLDHHVRGTTSAGRSAGFALEPMSVAEFHKRFVNLLSEIGASTRFNGRPNEIADGLPFADDVRLSAISPSRSPAGCWACAISGRRSRRSTPSRY